MTSIAAELERFLRRGLPEGFTMAEGESPPPPLSFMVSFPRLSLILRGSDEMEIEREASPIKICPKRGEVVFVPANAWNRPLWTHPVKVLHFLFGPKHIGISLVEHDGRGPQPKQVMKASLPAGGGTLHEILNAMTLLPRATSSEQIGLLLAQALLLGVAGIMREPPTVKTRKGRNTYEKVCLYLQEHFHQTITRESVADQFHLNPNHLSRLFKREGLMRFTDYLIWVRMDRAKYLLKHHDLKLDDLAGSCGFQDAAYFCRVFKQRTGRTPSRYRMEARTGDSTNSRQNSA